MLVADVVRGLESIAPTHLAEGWDNVGLLAGDLAGEARHALVTVDFTDAVAAEAQQNGADFVVAYHPPIFRPLRRIEARTPLAWALRHGVAVYSPHTALDAAEGGTNDVLADVLGLAARAPVRRCAREDAHLKLVTFVPAEAVERVSRAVFDVGAGRIGRYSACSFRGEGEGTFFGEEGARPAVGVAGRLEVAREVRVETVVPQARLEVVVAALREAHPYEEPAFDLVRLASPPEARGMGRIGTLAAGATREGTIARAKAGLGVDHVLVAGPRAGPIGRAAVCAGAAGELLAASIRQGADLVLTGEVRHHDALAAASAGVTVVCALHSRSERVALAGYAERIRAAVPGLVVTVSQADADPFAVV